MTHDLLRNVLVGLDVRVDRVTVADLRDGIYYATVRIVHAERTLELDARPSDAIALALRTGAPVYVERHVIELARQAGPASQAPDAPDALGQFLEGLSDDAFGKWKM
jgi:hypothetical protein